MQTNKIDVVFIATLVTATFLMGSSFIAGKVLIQNGFPALMLVGVRFIFAAAFALPLLFLEPKPYFSALLPKGLEKSNIL